MARRASTRSPRVLIRLPMSGRPIGTTARVIRMAEKYVAFLRGINLGKRRVKNDQLLDIFAGLGFTEIKVLIASGNVVFTADESDEAALTKTIEAELEKVLGFKIDTMLRRSSE